jgi:hypothetical protein
MTSRRNVIKTGITAVAGSFLFPSGLLYGATDSSFPVRAITKGPKFHWFGYYDKLQFDPTQRYVLGMEVNFEGRSPKADDEIRIGMVDLQDNDRWIDLGSSRAWGWQQGCMLQWIPGSKNEIIWNDCENGRFVSHILNVKTGKKRTLPNAVYSLSQDGKWAVGTDFSRIQNLRAGYGYAGVPDKHEFEKAPKEVGIYKLNIRTGKKKVLFSLADIASIPHRGVSVVDNYHWFNHLLINPDGSRFIFLNRWRKEKGDQRRMADGRFATRMFTANMDGSGLYCVDPSGNTSHFIWQDPEHICLFTRPEGQEWGFYILKDQTTAFERIGKGAMTRNGHQSFLPVGTGKEWLVCDNYAGRENRLQTPYLYHIPTDKKIELGDFFSPPEYGGEWRCDLHPRFSPDGNFICIDSPHGGNGRQLYLIDIHKIWKKFY